MSKRANNLRRMGNEAHDCGDWAAAEKLRQAADEIDRLTRERDEARAELARMTPPPREIVTCFVCGGPLPAGVSGVHPACEEAYR